MVNHFHGYAKKIKIIAKKCLLFKNVICQEKYCSL